MRRVQCRYVSKRTLRQNKCQEKEELDEFVGRHPILHVSYMGNGNSSTSIAC